MASEQECQRALLSLADRLLELDPSLRAKHIPRRTVACTVSDIDVTFTGLIDDTGVHDFERCAAGAPSTDVKIAVKSDELVALANGHDDLLNAWLRGRVQVSAPMRDMLRLRSVFGL